MLIRSLPAYSAAKVDTHIFRAPFAAAAHAPERRGSSPMMPLVNVIDPFSLKNGMAAFAKFNWLKHLVDSPGRKIFHGKFFKRLKRGATDTRH